MDTESVICRICLAIVPSAYTLLKENLLSTVNALTSIDISENDNLPKLSCSKCIYNLYFVENVRKCIINSDEKLRTIYLRDGNFNALLKLTDTTFEQQTEEEQIEEEQAEEEQTLAAVKVEEEVVDSSTIIDVSDLLEQCDDGTNEQNLPLNGDNEEPSLTRAIIKNKTQKIANDIIYRKNNEKPFLYHCNVCDVDFYGNKLYMVHKGKHTKKTCEICGVTTRQDNFNKHMTNHTLGQQICDICGSIHKSLEGLRTHLFHFHNAKKKRYSCAECGQTFKYSHRLSYHKRKVHTGFRPHQCESCGKRFFDLGTMKKHVKLIHLKLREYPCKYCQKDYSSRYALKVHLRQHTDETPYVCEYCTEGFRQLVSLKTHLARYHKEKPSTSQTDPNDIEEDKEELVKVEYLPQV